MAASIPSPDSVKVTFSVLDSHPWERTEDLFREALQKGNPPVQKQSFRVLKSRGGKRQIRLLLEAYPELPLPLKKEMAENITEWTSFAIDFIKQEDFPEAENVLDILQDCKKVKAASIASAAIRSSQWKLRNKGVRSLHKITEAVIKRLRKEDQEEENESPEDDYAQLWTLSSTYHELLPHYDDIDRTEFLEGFVQLGEPAFGAVKGILLDSSHPAHQAMKETLSKSIGQGVLEVLLRLTHETNTNLKQFGEKELSNRPDQELADMLFSYLRIHSRKRFLELTVMGEQWGWLSEVYPHLSRLNPETAKKFLYFIREIPRDQFAIDEVREGISHLLRHSDRKVQQMAIHNLLELSFEEVPEHLLTWFNEFDDQDRMKVLIKNGDQYLTESHLRTFLSAGLRSEDSTIRRLCGRLLADKVFEDYVEQYDQMDEETRKNMGQRLKEIDPDFVDRISEELNSLDPERKIRALKVIEHTGAKEDIDPLLYGLVSDPDKRVRATVVKAIGVMGDKEAMRKLIELLSDPDRRVQSNTMEALEEIGYEGIQKMLVPYLTDEDNRIRSTAAKVLWELGYEDSEKVLKNMLEHDRADMRISAIWALGEIHISEAPSLLAKIVENDPNEDVRRKAKEVLKKVLDQEEGSSE